MTAIRSASEGGCQFIEKVRTKTHLYDFGVEYIHHADLIQYDEFDKTHWSFEIHQASPEETKDCLSWMAREGSFHPTAFGAKVRLPDPRVLSCFLMEKRPSVVSQSVPRPPSG